MSDLSQVSEVDDILKVSIVSQVEHHLYFPESFLCTLCMNVPYLSSGPERIVTPYSVEDLASV